MTAIVPPRSRRRLAWTFRAFAAALWLILGFYALVATTLLVREGTDAVRDVTTGQAVAFAVFGAFLLVVAAFVLRACHRAGRRWSRAARVDPPVVVAHAVVTSIARRGMGTHLDVDVSGASWRLRTEMRADDSGRAGDRVALELYATHGQVTGAYRNERTGQVRTICGLA